MSSRIVDNAQSCYNGQMRTVVQIAACFLLSSHALADLPKSVLRMLDKRRPELKEVLALTTKRQHELLLERFADLLPKSNLYLFEKVDRDELLSYLKLKFPVEQDPKDAPHKEESLKGLSETLGARARGQTIDIDFKCSDGTYGFPLQVESKKDALRLTLRGIEVPTLEQQARNPSYCLEIEVSSSRKSLRIENLRTQTVACALPVRRAGECLLELAEWIGQQLDAERSTLADFSKVRCPRNSAFTDLRRLKIFKEGQGWYEKKGYGQVNLSEDIYVKRLKEFRGYAIDALRRNLEVKQVGGEQIDLLDARVSKYFGEGNADPTFSAFMRWLWDDDCIAYIEIEKLVFLRKNALEIGKLYPEVYDFVKPLSPK